MTSIGRESWSDCWRCHRQPGWSSIRVNNRGAHKYGEHSRIRRSKTCKIPDILGFPFQISERGESVPPPYEGGGDMWKGGMACNADATT